MQEILGLMRNAIDKYNMIENGDKIAVAVSGGKDSVVLLAGMAGLKRFYPKQFELVAITLDPCFNSKETDYSRIEELCGRLNVPYHIKRTDLGDVIFREREEKNPCSLCARMRRGILHDTAKEYGCNKIALGHHMDDAVETFIMNLFMGGQIGSFSPVSYLSRKDLYMIRPMILAEERIVENVLKRNNLPVVKSECPVDGITERQNTKELLKELEEKYPALRQKIIGAMQKGNISKW